MIADKIKILRENLGLSQAELGKKLGITRSSVNSWEQGISVPSTPYLIELSKLFHVSTDYLLELPDHNVVDVTLLNDTEVGMLVRLSAYFRETRSENKQDH